MAEQRFHALLQRNREYAQSHKSPGTIQNFVDNVHPDFRGIFIVTCADPRLDPSEFLGLRRGEANVIRNAAGRVDSNTLQGLEAMGSMIPIGLVVIIHHTDCGAIFITDDYVRAKLRAQFPEHASMIKDKTFDGFRHTGLEGSVRQDIDAIRAWPFLPKDANVVGYVYDLETGLMREVDAPVHKLENL